MAESILIIGAGIAGLAAGCYAQMNGYRSQILEMHTLPGGVCTAWKRKGYTFDGCIHHLAGCKPSSLLYPMWQVMGAMPRPIIYPEELVRIEGPDGQQVTLYHDPDRLEAHMKEVAPDDAPAIEAYVDGVRAFAGVDMMDMPVATARDMLGYVPTFVRAFKWFGMPMSGLGQHFRTPFLRRAMPFAQYNALDTPVGIHMNMLQQCSAERYGWPAGGSLPFARDIAACYEALGGEIHYRARVAEILVEEGGGVDRAVGVRLEDGTEHRADVVISTTYGQSTIFGMLGGRYTNKAIRSYYDVPLDTVGMGIMVSLGVDRDLSAEPMALVLLLEEPVPLADQVLDRLAIELYGHDPSLAPPGKGVLRVFSETSYRYWADLHRDRERYREAKARVAERVIDLLEPRFPGLRAQVEVVDVATTATTERYTGNRHGYQPNFVQFMWGMATGNGLSKTLPGLDHFYMAGQWAGAPGLPQVAGMGRGVIRTLCKRDGKRFVTR
jgi:phytoene dehydrogenase-like protein